MLLRRSTDTGLGPRQTVIARRNASIVASSRPRFSASLSSADAPTPVMKTTRSKRFAQSASTNAVVSAGCSVGVSRTAGTEYGVPPCRSTIDDSSLLIRASSSATLFPFSDIAGDLTAVAENPRLPHRCRVPSRLPPGAQFEQRERAGGKRQREEHQPARIAAGEILRRAENRRQEESAQAPGGADDARDDAHPSRKPLRHELEDGAVAHAEAAHGEKQQRHDHGERGQRRDEAQRDRRRAEQHQQQPVPAETVRQPAAERAHQASGDDHDRREVAGADSRHLVLLVEKRREKAGEADEAAEREAVQEGEPERVGLAQDLRVV